MLNATARRPPRFLDALLPYLGSKKKLLGRVFRALPPASEAPVLLDVFSGSGAVSLAAKARGYGAHSNDLALRAFVAARGLVANDRIRLSRDDVLRLFAPVSPAPPEFIQRHFAGTVLPARQCEFLDNAFAVARGLVEPKRSLTLLLLARFVLELRPMSNWGARTIIEQLDERRFDDVNRHFLRERTVRAAESHPFPMLEKLREKVNRGVFGGAPCTAHQQDAISFLTESEGSIVVLDPPYPSTTSYERSLKPLDEMLAGKLIEPQPSVFSGPHWKEALEHLLEACRHVPHLLLTFGNAAITPEDLERLVARHRHDVQMETVQYAHLAALASEESKERNLEVLVRAGRAR